jgi:transcription-repair coupling factor (superfamily II helicase)
VAQFAVRGGLMDFFPPHAQAPYRVEFWGDEIDTISTFDPATQRRVAAVEKAEIVPAREALFDSPAAFARLAREKKASLKGKYGALAAEQIENDLITLEEYGDLPTLDKYLPLLYEKPATVFDYVKGGLLFVCEPVSVKETLKNAAFQIQEDTRELLERGVIFPGCDTFGIDFVDVLSHIQRENTVLLDSFTRSLNEISLRELYSSNAIQLSAWSGEYRFLKEDVDSYLEREYCVVIFGGAARACAALLGDLLADGVPASVVEDMARVVPGRVFIIGETLSAGMEYPDIKLAIITRSKAAPLKQRKTRRPGKGEKKIRRLSDLTAGDYVVHSAHGIGVFEGVVKRDIHGVIKDYLKIRYAGTDMLFVPVTQLDLVSKYIGGGGENARVHLNKLNSAEWQKTRAKVKAAVKDMAKELTALYARRMTAEGYAFSEDDDFQRDFETRFPFEETEDQLRCVDEIKKDMHRPSPMDRLLCGDVGFGKTEVALRGIFKCVLDGKQCAVLVPTTILAWQHYQTFLQRLEGFPVTVELLSRFKSKKEQEDIIRRIKEGGVDVVIGTHRLVQKDVEFKDLGLCVIDEEQRFGVAHKEKFKQMRGSVDVLTLSATPIPRTLNMAMSGIRDMSIIEEAPQDRVPVQTYVLEHDDGVIAQAIRKELRRGGQVFYLHNRIDTIDSRAARLHEMIPEARIMTAHGKIGEERLSGIWQKLLEHEIDVLCCTTIIETGVDVPNCNTLIIEDADHMGLAQLYQLRGRVGRSSRRAYAYLTFRRGKALTDVAAKRLSTIRDFTTFGSGIEIARRDLEIRGAGNFLGAQQHGQMGAVGYDLYLKLLSDAVAEESGQAEKRPYTECMIDIRMDAHIPESYIENLSQRIDIYKKIASVETPEDVLDLNDELIDRFGEPPPAVGGLVEVALIRNTASMLGFKEIRQTDDRVLLYPETLDMELAAGLASEMKGKVLVNPGSKPYLAVLVGKNTAPLDVVRDTLAIMQRLRR